jgi:thiol-disulfide isomerase/thioredoxin
VTTLDGETIRTADLAGRIVVLEIWASWCPPCLSTLGWLQEISERQDAPITVLAVAVESDQEQVRKVARAESLSYPVVVADEALAAALGSVLAVPTLHVFDPSGKNVGVFYGAPDDLHQRIGALLSSLSRP